MNVKEKVEINGEILKGARETKGLSQEELAKKIFSTRQSISNWETGKKVPTLENIKRLAEILEIPVDDLIIKNTEGDELTDFLKIDEETPTDRMINYTLVYDKDKRVNKKFKKISIVVALIVALLLLIYLCSSIRKFIILNDINNKRNGLDTINNYFYTIITCEYTNDILMNNYKEEGYYINNNLKSEIVAQDGKKRIQYFLDNVHYNINLTDNTYTVENIDSINNILDSVNIKIDVVKLIFNTINFKYKIVDSNYYYYLFYKENINGRKYCVEEKINKQSGIIEQRTLKYDNFSITEQYSIKINSADNTDLELINLETFEKR